MAIPEQEKTSVSTTEIGRPGGKLVLPGAGSSEATVEVIYQSQATRASRALITLAVAILIAPVLFFLPPSFLWPIVAIAAGGLLAWRYWTGECYVTHFEGACPRCETPLEMTRGTRIRGEHTLDCHGCHRHPTLVLNDPEHPPEEPGNNEEPEAVEEPEAAEEPETGADADIAPAATEAGSGRDDMAGDRRAAGGDRRSAVGNRRDTSATATRPTPTPEEPTAVLEEPRRQPDELGG